MSFFKQNLIFSKRKRNVDLEGDLVDVAIYFMELSEILVFNLEK